jgi:hypothetical protein
MYRDTIIIFIWAVLVAGMWAAMLAYERTPGGSIRVTERWPVHSGIPCSENKSTLVMFAHPRCPCTHASMEEWSKITVQGRFNDIVTIVVFYEPLQQPRDQWRNTELVDKARKSGAIIVMDPEGKEARLFGAITSGSVRLYDPRGNLRYAGGLTTERGHGGDNESVRKLTAILKTPGKLATSEATLVTPVFGCPILVDTEAPAGGSL